MDKYIVRADIPNCNGAGCRVCEQYIDGFFATSGGIVVIDNKDQAELAAQFCPTQCIEVTKCRKV